MSITVKKYDCGHVSKGLLVLNSSPTMLSAYMRWKESGSTKCFDCWYNSQEEDEKMRNLVLGYLYTSRKQASKKQDTTRNELLKMLRIEDTVLDTHIKELAEQYLVYVQTPMPHLTWTHAHITTRGMAQHETENQNDVS